MKTFHLLFCQYKRTYIQLHNAKLQFYTKKWFNIDFLRVLFVFVIYFMVVFEQKII